MKIHFDIRLYLSALAIFFIISSNLVAGEIGRDQPEQSDCVKFLRGSLPEEFEEIETFSKFPQQTSGLAVERYLGVAKIFYLTNIRLMKEGTFPDYDFTRQNLHLVRLNQFNPNKAGKDVAFLRYRLRGKDVMIVQTGGQMGKLCLFIKKGGIQEIPDDPDETIEKEIAQWLNASRLGETVIRKLERGHLREFRGVDSTNDKVNRFLCLQLQEDICFFVPRTYADDPVPARVVREDQWFEKRKNAWEKVSIDSLINKVMRESSGGKKHQKADRDTEADFSKASLIKGFEDMYSKRKPFQNAEERIQSVRDIASSFKELERDRGTDQEKTGEMRKFLVLSFAHLAGNERDPAAKKAMLSVARDLIKVPTQAGKVNSNSQKKAKAAVDSAMKKVREAEAVLETLQDSTDDATVTCLAGYLSDDKISLSLMRKIAEILAQGENPAALEPLMRVIENHNDAGLLRMAEIGIKRILKHSTVDKNGLLSKKAE